MMMETKLIQKLFRSCLDILFPSGCPACGNNMSGSPLPICRECENALISGKVPPAVSSAHIPEILACRSYDGVVRKCVHRFKYQRKRRMIRAFEWTIRELLHENGRISRNIDLIVPVPIHRIRRRSRGFNQAEIIADALSGILLVPLSIDNLVKIKNTVPQIKTTGRHRTNNLKNSFSVRDPSLFGGRSILLVDDVMTTGATLDTCAARLLSAGAKEVFGFTLARTI